MRDNECVAFLQWALPRLHLRWPGFRKVRRQVCKRIGGRLTALGLETLDQYRNRLESDPAEWNAFDALCHVTISRFYRDTHVFDCLGARVLPELARSAERQVRPLRCWCVGCASGEEVYTLKILWDLEVESTRPRVRFELIGTDVAPAVLQRAERGCFGAGSLKDIPIHWRAAAFTRSDHEYCVRAVHREGVTFLCQDIRAAAPAAPFDLILCRNLVSTYFAPELQRVVLDRLLPTLRDGGCLVIGAHERLPGGVRALERIGPPEILRKRPRQSAAARAGTA